MAAAVAAARRRAPLADAIIDVILRSDQGWGSDTLLDSLMSLLDEPTLVEGIGEDFIPPADRPETEQRQ